MNALMRSKMLCGQVAGLLVAIGLASSASAAPITWGAAQNTAAPSDVSTAGSTVEAYNLTSAAGSTTVNGVTFTNIDSLLPLSTGVVFLAGATTGNAAYNALLEGLDYGGGTTESLSIGGGALVSGASYELQVWYTDLRTCCSARTMTYGDGLGNNVNLGASTGGFGQYALGNFTADAGTQTLYMASINFANVHLTAYQLRAVPEPAPLALLALAVPLVLGGVGLRRLRR